MFWVLDGPDALPDSEFTIVESLNLILCDDDTRHHQDKNRKADRKTLKILSKHVIPPFDLFSANSGLLKILL